MLSIIHLEKAKASVTLYLTYTAPSIYSYRILFGWQAYYKNDIQQNEYIYFIVKYLHIFVDILEFFLFFKGIKLIRMIII